MSWSTNTSYHSSSNSKQQDQEDASFYIFDHAVELSSSTTTATTYDDDDDTLREYSACIIFNIALTYHRRGVTTLTVDENKRPVLLQKAETLYSMVLKLLVATNTSIMSMIKAAAHNNLSQIYYTFGFTMDAQEEFHQIEIEQEEFNNSNSNKMMITHSTSSCVLLMREVMDGIDRNTLLINPLAAAPVA